MDQLKSGRNHERIVTVNVNFYSILIEIKSPQMFSMNLDQSVDTYLKTYTYFL